MSSKQILCDKCGHILQNWSSNNIKITPPIKSKPNPNLFGMNFDEQRVVTYRNVHPCDDEFDKIDELITNDFIVIENLVRIYNPFLELAYNLKKAQKQKEFKTVEEHLMFHGTYKEYLSDICTYNFNWRFWGSNSGNNKYGRGVSFSTNANYASNYSESGYHKVMIIAKVLVANACQGNSEMILPPKGFDTSQKDDGIVTVKYEDNEFLPIYKLYYHFD